MDAINDDEANIDFDKILRIANQLKNSGCSNESTEMKQINAKIFYHLKLLKSKTDAIVLSIETIHDLITVQNTMNELNTIQSMSLFFHLFLISFLIVAIVKDLLTLCQISKMMLMSVTKY